MATTLTPIEEKKQQNKNTAMKKLSKNNNWSGFLLSLFAGVGITLVVGLSGANFIYLTRLANEPMYKNSDNENTLDWLMPTDKDAYFPEQKNKEKRDSNLKNLNSDIFTHCGKNNTCDSSELCTNYKRLANFNIGTLGGWPYSMRDPKVPSPIGPWSQFKYWIADSVADAYIRNRSLFKKFLILFAPAKGKDKGNKISNQPLQMLMAGVLVACMPLVMFFIFFSCLVSVFLTSPIWSIVCIFLFLITFVINYGMTFVQGLQYMGTLTIVPLVADPKMVKNIFMCNGKFLIYFFLFFACMSATTNLETPIYGAMWGVYGLLVLIEGYKFLKNTF